MRQLLSLAAVGMLAGSAFAQGALNETFSYSTTSVFPPTGWTNNNLNAGSYPGWEEVSIQTYSTQAATLTSDAAVHDDQLSGVTNNYRLEAPTMDLSAYGTPELTYDGELYYGAFTVNGGSGDGESHIEVSTDGGATWTAIWSETSGSNYFNAGQTVDMSSVAGAAAVELGFRYYGTYAHGWVIDNVVVDNGGAPVGPSLSMSGTCPGPQSANAAGMTPGGAVAFYYALSAGSTTIPGGGCAGLTLPVSGPTQLGGFVVADGAGNVSLPGNTNPSYCGNVILGAVDVATCSGSNTVTL